MNEGGEGGGAARTNTAIGSRGRANELTTARASTAVGSTVLRWPRWCWLAALPRFLPLTEGMEIRNDSSPFWSPKKKAPWRRLLSRSTCMCERCLGGG